jgi:hypothetical protein
VQVSLNSLVGELTDSAKTPITKIADRVKAFVDDLPSLDDL